VGIYEADHIRFQWFKVVTRTTPDCDRPEMGILAVAARDVQIRANRIVNRGDTFGDCAFAVGIMAGYAPFFLGPTAARIRPAGLPEDLTTQASIVANTVRDHTFVGIAAVNSYFALAGGVPSGPTRAVIDTNSVRYLHAGQTTEDCPEVPVPVGISGQQRRSALRSVGAQPAGPGTCAAVGIYLGAGIEDSPTPGASGIIRENHVYSGPDAGFSVGTAGAEDATPIQTVGILVVDQRHTEGSTLVTRNWVFRNLGGIVGVDAKNLAVRQNRVTDSFYGIAILDTVTAFLRNNDAERNFAGLYVSDAGDSTTQPWYVTRDVRAVDNDARDNVQVSCVDDTEGDGTRGTANVWQGNRGEVNSSDPAGICGRAEPI
jgi:hypothetical protein